MMRFNLFRRAGSVRESAGCIKSANLANAGKLRQAHRGFSTKTVGTSELAKEYGGVAFSLGSHPFENSPLLSQISSVTMASNELQCKPYFLISPSMMVGGDSARH